MSFWDIQRLPVGPQNQFRKSGEMDNNIDNVSWLKKKKKSVLSAEWVEKSDHTNSHIQSVNDGFAYAAWARRVVWLSILT